MASVIDHIYKLLILLLLLDGAAAASAKQEAAPVDRLTSIYYDMKAGKLTLLGDREVHVRSEKAGNTVKADIYAISGHCFDDIHTALSIPENWCEFAPLHLNVKACTCRQGRRPVVTFFVGRKFYRPPEEAYALNYLFQVTESRSDRFRVKLSADDGPYGTSNFIILVEAVLIGGQTLVHMSLSYEAGLVSRIATGTYLSTLGSNKVGFSIDHQYDSGPEYVKGMKVILERNVMRYYLALSVYLETFDLDSADGFNQRAEAWFDLTEQYARHLHELNKQEYLEAKKREHQNQQELQRQIDLGQNPLVQGKILPAENKGQM